MLKTLAGIRIRAQGPARGLFECTQRNALKRGNGWELWNAYAKCFKAPPFVYAPITEQVATIGPLVSPPNYYVGRLSAAAKAVARQLILGGGSLIRDAHYVLTS